MIQTVCKKGTPTNLIMKGDRYYYKQINEDMFYIFLRKEDKHLFFNCDKASFDEHFTSTLEEWRAEQINDILK
jgi:hypothetical protein